MSRAPGRLASLSLSKWVVTAVDETSTTGEPLTVTRVADARRAHLDVDRRREAEADVDAFADDRREAGELEGERVVARRHGGKTIGAGLVGEGRSASSINDGPDRLTVTPGTTAFVLSVTMPLTAPVVAVTVCAAAVVPRFTAMKHRANATIPDRTKG